MCLHHRYLIFRCAGRQTLYFGFQLDKHVGYGGDARVKVFVFIVLGTEILLVPLALLQSHDCTVSATGKTQKQNYWRKQTRCLSIFYHCLLQLSDTRWQHIAVFLLFLFQERKKSLSLFFFKTKLPGICLTESRAMQHLMNTKMLLGNLQHIIRLLLNLICKIGICNKRNHNNENVKSFQIKADATTFLSPFEMCPN